MWVWGASMHCVETQSSCVGSVSGSEFAIEVAYARHGCTYVHTYIRTCYSVCIYCIYLMTPLLLSYSSCTSAAVDTVSCRVYLISSHSTAIVSMQSQYFIFCLYVYCSLTT